MQRELPLAHAQALDTGDDDLLLLSLEFGFDRFDSNVSALSFQGPSDPTDTRCAAFLHPVIRHRRPDGDWDEFHFGDSLLARWDRPHATGGAVMNYHHIFQRWADERLKLGLTLPEPVGTGAYRPWTEAEIAAYRDRQAVEPEASCQVPS